MVTRLSGSLITLFACLSSKGSTLSLREMKKNALQFFRVEDRFNGTANVFCELETHRISYLSVRTEVIRSELDRRYEKRYQIHMRNVNVLMF